VSRKIRGDIGLFTLGVFSIVIIAIISAIVTALSHIYSIMIYYKLPIIILVIVLICMVIMLLIFDYLYFKSEKFIKIKTSITQYINNCNELNHHISELKGSYLNIKSFDYGSRSIQDNSIYNFKRLEWSKDIKNNFIHNCSATVCKGASNQPLKYLCKYFNIEISEESLADIESVFNDFAAAEQGKFLLQNEKDSILNSIKSSIPWIINRFRKKKLAKELGFDEIDLSDLYFPVYTFQYVSAGGNSSMKCDIKLDTVNLEKLLSYLMGLINFRKSIDGQRALMTSALRQKIKIRDNFTCKKCGISANNERNLLLEIDHIIPLAKGGITTETNLQTLCWKCNRSKGAKIL